MNCVPIILLVWCALLGASTCTAHEWVGDRVEDGQAIRAESFTAWLKKKFSDAELERLQRGDVSVESHSCSCYDEPKRHFPYLMVVLRTPKGDLIARPELQEGAASFTPLAVRRERQYCDVESEQNCYGWFADPCDFTDARYGPHLAAYFPTCKSDESQTLVIQEQDVAH